MLIAPEEKDVVVLYSTDRRWRVLALLIVRSLPPLRSIVESVRVEVESA